MKLEGARGVRSPLQLFGLYLAWSESAIAAGLFATVNVEHWTRLLLIGVMAFGLVAYVLVASFMLIYLVVKRPGFLFNPSDYDSAVQHRLFDTPGIAVANPPNVPQG